jgi:flagellin
VNGVLTFSSSDYGKGEFVDINVLTSGSSFGSNVFNASSANALRAVGSDIVARINGQTAIGDGLKASISTALLNSSVTFVEANNVALTNAKITITGGGSLFQIGQDVSTGGQIGVGIEAVNTARLGGITGKLFELGSGGGKSLLDVGSGVTGDKLVSIINEARDRVNTLRARLGSLQKNVIETNITSLGVALEKIADARSTIADTDYAVETANLTKAQILNQAGISALQIANSAPQQVLTLLRQ